MKGCVEGGVGSPTPMFLRLNLIGTPKKPGAYNMCSVWIEKTTTPRSLLTIEMGIGNE
jgi:hypothetical protein